ncbi:hypothetical protein KY285_014700 [Solanum tuberosum]|nr:hypothetical protein KY285_014700 [Solanum tuberosum]
MVNSKDNSSTDSENSSGDVPNSKPSLYFEGEKVLAYHGPRIYEAKACFFYPTFPANHVFMGRECNSRQDMVLIRRIASFTSYSYALVYF